MSGCSILAIATINPIATAVIAASYAAGMLLEHRSRIKEAAKRLEKSDDKKPQQALLRQHVSSFDPKQLAAQSAFDAWHNRLQGIHLQREDHHAEVPRGSPQFTGFLSHPVDPRLSACADMLRTMANEHAGASQRVGTDLDTNLDINNVRQRNDQLIEQSRLGETISEALIQEHLQTFERQLTQANQSYHEHLAKEKAVWEQAGALLDRVFQSAATAAHLLEVRSGLPLQHSTAQALQMIARQIQSARHDLLKGIDEKSLDSDSLALLMALHEQLQARVDELVEVISLQDVIVQRVDEHLHQLAYEPIGYTHEGRAEQTQAWRIPGGEQVHLDIDEQLRVSFQVRHEVQGVSVVGAQESASEVGESTSETGLADTDTHFFKQQETRWCDDFRELLKRLNEDGFQFQIAEESDVAIADITTVVVEDVAEWANARRVMQTQPAAQKRMLDD